MCHYHRFDSAGILLKRLFVVVLRSYSSSCQGSPFLTELYRRGWEDAGRGTATHRTSSGESMTSLGDDGSGLIRIRPFTIALEVWRARLIWDTVRNVF